MGMIPEKFENVMKDNAAMNDIMKQAMNSVPEQLSTFVKQNDLIIDNQNTIMLALASVYDLEVSIAKKIGATIPKPHTDMNIEKE